MYKNIVACLILFSTISNAQFTIDCNFNRNATANNQTISVGYQFNKFGINIGLKYLFNKKYNFPTSVFFKRTYWALNPQEHFGMTMSFSYTFWNLPKNALSIYYDFQFTNSSMRFETYYAYEQLVEEPQSEYDYSYIKHTRYFLPVLGFENNIGLQFQFYLSKNIFLNQKAGVGILFYKELDPANIVGDNGWVFSEMLSIGLGWKFDEKTKAK